MKNLEDIPKKNVFEVPEGYFDRLPGIIQALVAKPEKEASWILNVRLSLQYALPLLVIGVASLLYLGNPGGQSTDEVLASVDSSNLVAYLQDTDISVDELLENVQLDQDEADAIQKNSMNENDIDEQELQDLTDEFGTDYF